MIPARKMNAGPGLWAGLLVFAFFAAALAFSYPAFRENAPETLLRAMYMNPRHPDPGAHMIFTQYRKLHASLRPGREITTEDLFPMNVAFLLLCSACLLLSRAPLLAVIGAHATLFVVWMMFFDICSHGHAVEPWAVVMSSGLLMSLLHWRGGTRDWLSLVFFSLILGFLPLMRQSAYPTVIMPFAAAISIAVLARLLFPGGKAKAGGGGAPAPAGRGGAPWSPVLGPLWRTALLFALMFVVQKGILMIWHKEHGQATFVQHGAGFPLFLSLGFAENPYNIAWDDDIGFAHGLLVENKGYNDFDPVSQRKLTALFASTAAEDPGLVLRCVLAKASYLAGYFTSTLSLSETRSDMYPVPHSRWTSCLAAAFVLAVAFCARLFFRVRSFRMLILCSGMAGLFAAVFAPLLIVVPFYLGSAMALFMMTAFALAPCAFLVAGEDNKAGISYEERRGISRAYASVIILGAAATLLLLLFASVRAALNRGEAEKLVSADPIPRMAQLGFRYSHLFNRLDEDEQRGVLRKLLSSGGERTVLRPKKGGVEPQPGETFKPVLAVISDRMVYVAVWMSKDWRMRAPGLVQGPRNSVLTLARNSDMGPSVLYYMRNPFGSWKIADANWDGKYRMFCLPQPPGQAEPLRSLHIGASTFKGGSHVKGLKLEAIAGQCLYPAAGAP